MKPLQIHLILQGGLLCLAFVSGCSENRPAGMPKLTPCSLVIQYEDGTPLEDAIVMMFPQEGKWYSNGKTDSSGLAKMTANGSFAGAVPGEYKVTVKKQTIEYPPGYVPDDQKEDDNPPPVKITDYVAAKFVSQNSTPLRVTVTDTPVKETLKIGQPPKNPPKK